MYRHRVKHPCRHFFLFTWPTVSQNRFQPVNDFSLDEQITERRVGHIAGCWCQYHFGVAGDIERAGLTGTVSDRDASDLYIIFRGDHDMRVNAEGAA